MSSDLAIRARGVGKHYMISQDDRGPTSLMELVRDKLRHPFRRTPSERFWALRDVSFELPQGEVLGIIGRNGAGKSTLLKILSRITEPSAGEIEMRGRTGSLLEVGTGFHRELTGRENIFLNGSILGMSRTQIARQFDEIVDFAGTGRFLDTPVKRYSSGMYVRLAFAVAAHLNPDILIIDEVLSVGDAEFQKKCLGKIGDVARDGRSVLFVSHNLAAVRSLCTRALLLRDGGVEQVGTPEECLAAYHRLYQPAESEATARLTRPVDATAWMTAARLYCGAELRSRLDMGEELSVEIDFEADQPIRPAVGVVIFNSERVPMIHYSSRYAPVEALRERTRTGTIRLEFGAIPFTAGTFDISLYFGGPVDDSHVAQSCLSLEVVEHDMFGAGKVYDASHSLMWWPADVRLRPEALSMPR